MSKEDRYAHLGDGIEATTDGTDTDDGDDGTLRVTIEDGDETTVLTVDPEAASAEGIREAIERASGGRRSADPGQLALELGTLGPRLALKGVESLVEGLDPNRRGRE
jgi:hypothetical protein